MIKISVVTAVYNSRETVAAALDSILAQTHSDVEIVIVDGKSTDGTVEILERYRPSAAIFISEPDRGIYDALNKGVAKATGDIIGFLHADDVLQDDYVLARVAQAFESSHVQAVYGDLVYVAKDDLNRVIRTWHSGHFERRKLSRGWMPPHPTFYARRSVYERLGGFDPKYGIAADYDAMLRILCQEDFQITYIPEVLVRMRTGGVSNRSLCNILQKSREDLDIARRHRIGGLRTIMTKNLSKLSQFWKR